MICTASAKPRIPLCCSARRDSMENFSCPAAPATRRCSMPPAPFRPTRRRSPRNSSAWACTPIFLTQLGTDITAFEAANLGQGRGRGRAGRRDRRIGRHHAQGRRGPACAEHHRQEHLQKQSGETGRMGHRQPRRKTHARPARETGGGSGAESKIQPAIGENMIIMDVPDVERGFEQLIKSHEWRRLAKMPGVAETFNVFQVLDDSVCENSWSSILAVLFSSSGGHGLGMRPLRLWLSEVGDGRFYALAKRAASSSALREWGTMERRRLDILIKLLDGRGLLIGIIGIENKVWSGEQHEQLKDYQAALRVAFPSVPKMLLFLTPDEREPLTSVVSKLCPCRRCSYRTLCEHVQQLPNHLPIRR